MIYNNTACLGMFQGDILQFCVFVISTLPEVQTQVKEKGEVPTNI